MFTTTHDIDLILPAYNEESSIRKCIEDFESLPYAFETGEKESIQSSTGESYEGYQVFPTDRCSENNPDRNEDDCNEDDGEDNGEDNDDDDNDGGIIPDGQARSSHDGEDHDEEDHDEGEDSEGLFDDSEIIWFHDANTGHPAYINMDMPNLREDGYTLEMEPISHTVAEEKVEQNADPENPEKTELIEFDENEILVAHLPEGATCAKALLYPFVLLSLSLIHI